MADLGRRDDAAAHDRAERAATAALVEMRNAARVAEHEADLVRHRTGRRRLTAVTAVVAVYEIVWWVAALVARSRTERLEDFEERLAALRDWTVLAGPHWVFTVVAVVVLVVLWRRHLRRRPVPPTLDLPPDERRRHGAFDPDGQVPRRII
ncbi:hypothetical protein [Sanguibacter sp. HDW7]|uniref:hypothetical protein n=1 Tax=Sanguibacter sp. HDW7 TaxID=2714931 RepID=UPI00140C79D0|nr:hypothetical protein [Sanguibacter sp. HDW7]QIK83595.1 hypothetical protein G7063_08100 [Sanguibacter sp. HDW7]